MIWAAKENKYAAGADKLSTKIRIQFIYSFYAFDRSLRF